MTVGEIEGRTLAFLPRHGRGHRLSPSQINYRANVYAMKKIGADAILSISAVGSMKERIRPGDIVVVDQFYDHTKFRPNTFFGDGVAGHISFADPVCPDLAGAVYAAARKIVKRVHRGGIYLCMEGPAFSTRAESEIHRKWGVDVIGMTNMPEAKLAREAEVCYATIALATDYDCWHAVQEDVSVEAILGVLRGTWRTRRGSSGSGPAFSSPGRVPLRGGAQARDHHRPEEDPSGGEEAPLPPDGEVPVIGQPNVPLLPVVCLFAAILAGCAGPSAARKKEADARMRMGVTYLGQRNLPMAMQELTKASELDPGNAEVDMALGLVYQATRRHVEGRRVSPHGDRQETGLRGCAEQPRHRPRGTQGVEGGDP